MASSKYNRQRRLHLSRSDNDDDENAVHISSSVSRRNSSDHTLPTAHYLTRPAPRERSFHNDRGDDMSEDDELTGDDDEDMMTLSQRIFSGLARRSAKDARYEDLNSGLDRLVVHGETKGRSSRLGYDDIDSGGIRKANDSDLDGSDNSHEEIRYDDISPDYDTGVTKETEEGDISRSSVATETYSRQKSATSMDGSEDQTPIWTNREEEGASQTGEAESAQRQAGEAEGEEVGGAVSKDDRLRDFEDAMNESVASDDQFLQMVRKDSTRLSRDTKEWISKYSLDDSSISSQAQKLMEGDLRHLYEDLSPREQRDVEESLSRMNDMTLNELVESIGDPDRL